MRLVVPVLAIVALAAGALAAPAMAAASPATVVAVVSTSSSQPTGVARDHGALQKTGTCLKRHGVPASEFATVLSQDAPPTSARRISAKTLQSAGIACQSSMDKSTAAAVKRLDECMATHGINMARTGSTLANLLLVDPSWARVRSAISSCLGPSAPEG